MSTTHANYSNFSAETERETTSLENSSSTGSSIPPENSSDNDSGTSLLREVFTVIRDAAKDGRDIVRERREREAASHTG